MSAVPLPLANHRFPLNRRQHTAPEKGFFAILTSEVQGDNLFFHGLKVYETVKLKGEETVKKWPESGGPAATCGDDNQCASEMSFN